MASTTLSGGYMLQRDSAASMRLNAQHFVWQQELGFLLHPIIPALQDGARVADIATGTGAWLLEAAGTWPNVKFDGFDITLSQCPGRNLLPPNVNIDVWDILQDPPEDMIAKYDVVHIRCVILVIDDPIPALNNLSKLLKPGGYIQWDELDLSHTQIFGKEEGLKVDGVTTMDNVMRLRPHLWILELPELMSNHDFEDSRYYRIPPKREFSRYCTEIHIQSFVEILARNPEMEQKNLVTKMIQDVLGEIPSGAAQGVSKVVIVGRKKL